MTDKIFKQFIGTREEFEEKLLTYTPDERLKLAESIVFIHEDPKYSAEGGSTADTAYTGWIYANDFFYTAADTVGLTAQAVADLVDNNGGCSVEVVGDKLVFTPITKEAITVTTAVGNISKDTVFDAGTPIETILQQLLCKEEWSSAPTQSNNFAASVTQPTVTLSKTGTVEVGTEVTLSAYTAKASSATQSVSVATMKYGYRDGSATAAWVKAPTGNTYSETLTPSEQADSTVTLKAERTAGFTDYAGATQSGTATSLPKLAAQTLTVVEGTNTVKLTQTGSTWDAATAVTAKTLYVCTNLGHVTKSATDSSDNKVSVASTWGGASTKQATNNNSASVTGAYYTFYGEYASDPTTLTDASLKIVVRGLNKDFSYMKDVTSYDFSKYFIIAVPTGKTVELYDSMGSGKVPETGKIEGKVLGISSKTYTVYYWNANGKDTTYTKIKVS